MKPDRMKKIEENEKVENAEEDYNLKIIYTAFPSGSILKKGKRKTS